MNAKSQLYAAVLATGWLWAGTGMSSPSKSLAAPAATSTTSSDATKHLASARDVLMQEAARIQIQGRGLTKQENLRLKTLDHAIDTIGKLISSLNATGK